MAHVEQISSTAHAYARALLELANEQGQAQAIGEEFSGLREILQANPVFAEYLADPSIGQAERQVAFDRIFRGRISDLFLNFLGVLNRNRRLRMLSEIQTAYAELYDQQLGNIEVDVTSVQKLSDQDIETVRQRVGAALGKNAIVHEYVDESILGGLVLRVQDRLIDASVKNQLKSMQEKLLAARPK